MFRWRRPYFDWRIYPFTFFSVAIPAVYAYGITADPQRPRGLRLAFLTAMVLCMSVWMWRLAREGIYCGDTGVRVQRLIRSDVLRWDEISQVDAPGPGGELGFRTTDGRTVRSTLQLSGMVVGRTLSPILRRGAYDRFVALLRARHARAVGGSTQAEQAGGAGNG